MTRGTLFFYKNDKHIYSSVEYNGDMYHDSPESMGMYVLNNMPSTLKTKSEFIKVLNKVNSNYEYKDGATAYSVNEKTMNDEFIIKKVS